MTAITHSAGGSSRLAIPSAGILWSLGILILNILPVVFQALDQSRHLTADQLGTLGAVFIIGTGVSTGSGPFWARRTKPNWVSAAALMVTAASLAIVTALPNGFLLTCGWFVVGLASGAAATPAFTALGDTADPLKTYSAMLFMSLVMAALLSFGLPLVIQPRFGGGGALFAIGLLFALAIPMAFVLPDVRLKDGDRSHFDISPPGRARVARRRRRAFAAPILAVLAGALFTGTFQGGVYNFVGTIAATNGFSAQATGLFVTMSLIGALVGSILPSILGARVSSVAMICLSTVVAIVTYPAMLSHSTQVFGAAFVVHITFTMLAYTCFLGEVRVLDFTDRIYIAYPALQSFGIAAGTAATGYLLSRSNPLTLFIISAILLVASCLGLLVARTISTRTTSI